MKARGCACCTKPKEAIAGFSAGRKLTGCFHKKLVCSLTISDGCLALSAKLLARSNPKFKFLWVISITLRFTVAALWFAASRNFVIEYIAASASCWRGTRMASGHQDCQVRLLVNDYYIWLQLGLLICKLCEIANSPS